MKSGESGLKSGSLVAGCTCSFMVASNQLPQETNTPVARLETRRDHLPTRYILVSSCILP
jgi:hypothetical protein